MTGAYNSWEFCDPFHRVILRCDQCGNAITLQHSHGMCSDECQAEYEYEEMNERESDGL